MEDRLLALKLILDEAGIGPSIRKMRDRKRVQKVVYLLQAAGVPTNYSFGWYIKGTYSTTLTRDYYALDDALKMGELPDGGRLRAEIRDVIGSLRPMFEPPVEEIADDDWVELVAAVHYLKQRLGYDPTQVSTVLKEQKPHVAEFERHAVNALADSGLLD